LKMILGVAPLVPSSDQARSALRACTWRDTYSSKNLNSHVGFWVPYRYRKLRITQDPSKGLSFTLGAIMSNIIGHGRVRQD